MPTTATRAVRASRRDRRRSASVPFFATTGVIGIPPWKHCCLVYMHPASRLGGEGLGARGLRRRGLRPPTWGCPSPGGAGSYKPLTPAPLPNGERRERRLLLQFRHQLLVHLAL